MGLVKNASLKFQQKFNVHRRLTLKGLYVKGERIYWVVEVEVYPGLSKEIVSVCDILTLLSSSGRKTLSLPWGLHAGGSYLSQTVFRVFCLNFCLSLSLCLSVCLCSVGNELSEALIRGEGHLG